MVEVKQWHKDAVLGVFNHLASTITYLGQGSCLATNIQEFAEIVAKVEESHKRPNKPQLQDRYVLPHGTIYRVDSISKFDVVRYSMLDGEGIPKASDEVRLDSFIKKVKDAHLYRDDELVAP